MSVKRVLGFVCLMAVAMAARDLEIYAIDVEGGKSTLYISPSGQTMLIDAGYGGFEDRDAKRIAAVLKLASVKQIDFLVVTHFHSDHVGGVPRIAEMIPVKQFIDHGKSYEKTPGKIYDDYAALRDKSKHTLAEAGYRIPIKGMDVEVVTGSGKGITKPLAGAGDSNPTCTSYKAMEQDPGENAHSLGMIMTYGKFRLADLGDLFWNQEFDLACPTNKLGTVDVYMTTHHGTGSSGAPQIVNALHPRVAIMNNGAKKGGSVEALKTIHASPGLEDLWQLHYSLAGGKEQNTGEQFIANPEEKCAGNWLRLTARADGTFTVYNSRNKFEKTY